MTPSHPALAELRERPADLQGLRNPANRPAVAFDPEVESLRKSLLAGKAGPVTRAEAESLFDHAAVRHGRGHDAFADFFALAIGNHLLSCGGSVGPEMDEVLRRGRWLDGRLSSKPGLEGCFSRVLTCVITGDGFVDARGGWIARSAARLVLDAKFGAARSILACDDAAWMRDRIALTGAGFPAITALIGFIGENAPAIGSDDVTRPLEAVA